ncbi:MAG: ferrous iron transport protein A [Candidatus Cloacimonetes bacterium]|nr:ferrous iron transport protein A [Candidatus Cloacimonadota bacterium]
MNNPFIKFLHRKRKNKMQSHSMFHSNRTTCHDLEIGETAKIIKLHGGHHFVHKAESLGIREGIDIKLISAQIMQGPLTLQAGHTKIAIGYGMAFKIEVEKNK